MKKEIEDTLVEIPKHKGKKKKTRKWCKGKVGVEHKTKWIKISELKHTCNALKEIMERKGKYDRRVLVCVVCGKELKIDWNCEYIEEYNENPIKI
jgi:hypothetical protein